MLGRPKLKDVRGRLVLLAPHELLIRDPARKERLIRAGWRYRAEAVGSESLRSVLPLVMTMTIFVLLPMTIAIFMDAPLWVQVVMAPALSAFVSFAACLFWSRRLAPNHIATIYLRAGYCPSCGYDLDALVPAPDDLRTCPECGGAWKLASRD
jgi:hypothetical protein